VLLSSYVQLITRQRYFCHEVQHTDTVLERGDACKGVNSIKILEKLSREWVYFFLPRLRIG